LCESKEKISGNIAAYLGIEIRRERERVTGV
jgi:hypothetical protein